jgi:lipoyl(octanoyl) transferase
MDLRPFSYINPCGYEGLASTQIKDLRPDVDIKDVKQRLIGHLNLQLSSAN